MPRSLWPRNNKLDDIASGRLVEIAGRLVGNDDGGIGRERAGERDALLLAAGKLGRIVMEAVALARRRQARVAARDSASGTPASSSGTATFSSAVMVGIR